MTDLARRRSLPPGGTTAPLAMADGWPVRTMLWPRRDGGPGSILLVNGRADFIEKYAETIWDLTDAGWGVATFDWRGQGLSGRLGNTPMKGHAGDFGVWVADFGVLAQWFAAALPGPHFAMAHSMGGHLLLRALEAAPGPIARAVLLSPMLGIRAAPLGPGLARGMALWATILGGGGNFVTGGGPYLAREPGSPRQKMLTHDAERYADEGWWIGQAPGLAIGAVTWGWTAAAFRSLDALFAPGALEGVTTPLLILTAATDALVDNAGAARAVARLRGATLETIAGAGHELLREVPAVRRAVLARSLAFLGEAA